MHSESNEYSDLAFSQLIPLQQEFLRDSMHRGKRTAWLNALAEIKGIVISQDDDDEEIVAKIGGWYLESFADLGTREGKCACGQSIRYVYHVKHAISKESLDLGSTCIETYTGLDEKTVAAVIKSMKKIDLELDEILKKLVNGWRLMLSIPPDLSLPCDIQQHLSLDLPLLDRQVLRLKKLIANHLQKNENSPYMVVNVNQKVDHRAHQKIDHQDKMNPPVGWVTFS
ncbi:hypothetical protein ABHN11_24715 [Brevibacillus centrosporus]|uniref:hypothetical protein n=1 Tax=Brevibacillus centrosporus TaxID=54910 RepID=UPI003D192CFD